MPPPLENTVSQQVLFSLTTLLTSSTLPPAPKIPPPLFLGAWLPLTSLSTSLSMPMPGRVVLHVDAAAGVGDVAAHRAAREGHRAVVAGDATARTPVLKPSASLSAMFSLTVQSVSATSDNSV